MALSNYPAAARFGYPDQFWWAFLVTLAELLGEGPQKIIPRFGHDDRVQDSKVFFTTKAISWGIVVCEIIESHAEWQAEARKSMDEFSNQNNLKVVLLVGHTRNGEPGVVPQIEAVIGDEPMALAQHVFGIVEHFGV